MTKTSSLRPTVMTALAKLPVFIVAAFLTIEAWGQGCVAVFVTVRGSVSAMSSPAVGPEKLWPAKPMQCLPPERLISLRESAEATLFFPAHAVAVQLRGPGEFVIQPNRVRPLKSSPSPIETKLNAIFSSIKLDRDNLVPAGVRMRDPSPRKGPVAIAPSGIVTSPLPLEFSWDPKSSAPPYRFRLIGHDKAILHEELTSDNKLVLPEGTLKTAGEPLLWQVESVTLPGEKSDWVAFVIATHEAKQLAAEVDRNVPSPSAVELVLRDALLLQRMHEHR